MTLLILTNYSGYRYDVNPVKVVERNPPHLKSIDQNYSSINWRGKSNGVRVGLKIDPTTNLRYGLFQNPLDVYSSKDTPSCNHHGTMKRGIWCSPLTSRSIRGNEYVFVSHPDLSSRVPLPICHCSNYTLQRESWVNLVCLLFVPCFSPSFSLFSLETTKSLGGGEKNNPDNSTKTLKFFLFSSEMKLHNRKLTSKEGESGEDQRLN